MDYGDPSATTRTNPRGFLGIENVAMLFVPTGSTPSGKAVEVRVVQVLDSRFVVYSQRSFVRLPSGGRARLTSVAEWKVTGGDHAPGLAPMA